MNISTTLPEPYHIDTSSATVVVGHVPPATQETIEALLTWRPPVVWFNWVTPDPKLIQL